MIRKKKTTLLRNITPWHATTFRPAIFEERQTSSKQQNTLGQMMWSPLIADARKHNMQIACMLQFCWILVWHASNGQLTVPGLKYEAYVKNGDINIGFLIYVHGYSANGFCSEEASDYIAFFSEVPSYVTNRLSKDDSILPNVSLGYVVLDTCMKDLTALAVSTLLVKSSASCEEQPAVDQHRVVGVVGPPTSRQAVMVASFLGLFELPVLGPYTTSEELSDKTRFPYFLRLVPPDVFQTVAILDIVDHFGWSYVSLLYSEGSYGENAAKHIERLVKTRRFCLAVNKRIAPDVSRDEIRRVVSSLAANRYAPVVIIFLESTDLVKVFTAVKDANLTHHFRWISGDSFWSIFQSDILDVGLGALFTGFDNGDISDFYRYILSHSWKNSTNPWMPLIIEKAYGCSWQPTNSTDAVPCSQYDNLSSAPNLRFVSVSKYIDAFLVFAQALHNLIADHCPQLFLKSDNRNFDSCITGSRLLSYLKNGTFHGSSETISFDERGDAQGKYIIYQLRKGTSNRFLPTRIGKWQRDSASLVIYNSTEQWLDSSNILAHPVQSICSLPCSVGHYFLQKEIPCCWECIACRDSEITNANLTGCERCPDFTWPDADTRSFCEKIEPRYPSAADVTGSGLMSTSVAGVLVALGILAVYVIKRKHRLIKATSRELSSVSLVGCILACVVSMLYFLRPDDNVCVLRHVGFHLAVCIIYSPLLAKTLRVYRIFTAGRRGNERLRFISNKPQLLFTALIIALQVVILMTLNTVTTSRSELTMPFPHEPYVELKCLVTLILFVPPLAINIVLIMACVVLGFLTRKLPENFNESHYIFVSTSTTLFMWSVFLPTYFTSIMFHHQVILLSICLQLNSYITLLVQYGSKVYAVFFVKEENLKFHRPTMSTTVSAAPSSNVG